MPISEKQTKYIYIKSEQKWTEVSEEYYKEHIRFYNTFRKRQQSHGQCVCPKDKFWLCDGDCYNCEFEDSNEYGFYCMIFGNRFGLPCADFEPKRTEKKEGVKAE